MKHKPKPSDFKLEKSLAKNEERMGKFAAGTDEQDLLVAMSEGKCKGEKIGKKHKEAAEWATKLIDNIETLMLNVTRWGLDNKAGQEMVLVRLNRMQAIYDDSKGERRTITDIFYEDGTPMS